MERRRWVALNEGGWDGGTYVRPVERRTPARKADTEAVLAMGWAGVFPVHVLNTASKA